MRIPDKTDLAHDTADAFILSIRLAPRKALASNPSVSVLRISMVEMRSLLQNASSVVPESPRRDRVQLRRRINACFHHIFRITESKWPRFDLAFELGALQVGEMGQKRLKTNNRRVTGTKPPTVEQG